MKTAIFALLLAFGQNAYSQILSEINAAEMATAMAHCGSMAEVLIKDQKWIGSAEAASLQISRETTLTAYRFQSFEKGPTPGTQNEREELTVIKSVRKINPDDPQTETQVEFKCHLQ